MTDKINKTAMSMNNNIHDQIQLDSITVYFI